MMTMELEGTNKLQTTINVETEVPLAPHSLLGTEVPAPQSDIELGLALAPHSLKRWSQEKGNNTKEARKKRRSSLATKRRSITGDALHSAGSQDAVSSQGNSSSTSDEMLSSQSQEKPSLLPNPANVRMDQLIHQMETQIKKLNEEYEKWQELLESHTKKTEESELLMSNLSLPALSIPDEIREVAVSDYINVKPLDLVSVRHHVTKLLSDCQFDTEAYCEDLRLIKCTVERTQLSNKVLADRLKQVAELKRETEQTDIGLLTEREVDPKMAIAKLISQT